MISVLLLRKNSSYDGESWLKIYSRTIWIVGLTSSNSCTNCTIEHELYDSRDLISNHIVLREKLE